MINRAAILWAALIVWQMSPGVFGNIPIDIGNGATLHSSRLVYLLIGSAIAWGITSHLARDRFGVFLATMVPAVLITSDRSVYSFAEWALQAGVMLYMLDWWRHRRDCETWTLAVCIACHGIGMAVLFPVCQFGLVGTSTPLACAAGGSALVYALPVLGCTAIIAGAASRGRI